VIFLYMIVLSFGWGYLGDKYHWPMSVRIVAFFMTVTFAILVARLVEGDRR
jgi:hypothetical protein